MFCTNMKLMLSKCDKIAVHHGIKISRRINVMLTVSKWLNPKQ